MCFGYIAQGHLSVEMFCWHEMKVDIHEEATGYTNFILIQTVRIPDQKVMLHGTVHRPT